MKYDSEAAPRVTEYDSKLSPLMWERLIEIFKAKHKAYPYKDVVTPAGSKRANTCNALNNRCLIYIVGERSSHAKPDHHVYRCSIKGARLAWAYLQGQDNV